MTRAATGHGGRSQPNAQAHAYERLSDLENQVGVMLRAMIKAGITIPVQSKTASSLFAGADEQAAQQHPTMDEGDSGGMEADTRRGWALPGPSTMPSPEPDTYGGECPPPSVVLCPAQLTPLTSRTCPHSASREPEAPHG